MLEFKPPGKGTSPDSTVGFFPFPTSSSSSRQSISFANLLATVPISTATMAKAAVSASTICCACSCTAPPSMPTEVRSSMPKEASRNAVFKQPRKCANAKSLGRTGNAPRRYQYESKGSGNTGARRNSKTKRSPSSSAARQRAPNHLASPNGGPPKRDWSRSLAVRKVRPMAKLQSAPRVSQAAEAIAPGNSPPNSIGARVLRPT
mmetsp:Transcript_20130/g.55459  ORF Transcript_20130/g.55459 Transcript_20130/m.55459 type:complete len:205 (-) Transcript_20130:883-1497(-)